MRKVDLSDNKKDEFAKRYCPVGRSHYKEKMLSAECYAMTISGIIVVIGAVINKSWIIVIALMLFIAFGGLILITKLFIKSNEKINYLYKEREIKLYYGKKTIKIIGYDKVKCIVICSAAELVNNYTGWYTVGYYIDKETFFQYAEIVLFESYDCVNFLRAGLYNFNLCSYWHGEKSISRDYINYYARIAEKNMTDLGICDFESLRELLLRTSANVYVLGDVYFRFQKELDAVIQETDGEQKVYLVLGNKDVVFYQYAKADAVRKDLSIAEAYKRIFPVKARYLSVHSEMVKDNE